MTLGYIAVGIMAGLLAAVGAALAGASFGTVALTYALAGCASIAVLALRRLLMRPRPTGPRILVADADPAVRDLATTVAGSMGIDAIATAAAGHATLALLVEARPPFSYLLLADRLPDVDAATLVDRVRQLPAYRDTPITVLTATPVDAAQMRALLAAARDFEVD